MLARDGMEHVVDVVEGFFAVHAGFAETEQVEIGTMKDEDIHNFRFSIFDFRVTPRRRFQSKIEILKSQRFVQRLDNVLPRYVGRDFDASNFARQNETQFSVLDFFVCPHGVQDLLDRKCARSGVRG